MAQDPKLERSFVMIKPDGLKRSIIGEIIARFERAGLKLIAAKMIMAEEDICWKHYNKDDAWFNDKGNNLIQNFTAKGLPIEKSALEYGKDILRNNIILLQSGPVIPMIWEGNQAVTIIKKLVGSTEPASSPAGTIRGDLALDSYVLANIDNRAVRNLIHCSDQVEEAEREIALWFKDTELFSYKSGPDGVLYDALTNTIK